MSRVERSPTGQEPQARAHGAVLAAWAALTVSVLGLLVAGYLAYEHLTASTTLACPDTGAINCAKVTTSAYSQFAGVPVAFLGLGYFVAMTLLCLPNLWHSRDRRLSGLRLAMSALGVLFVLYLIWTELFRINAICLWCTAVHLLTLVLFGIIAIGQAMRVPQD